MSSQPSMGLQPTIDPQQQRQQAISACQNRCRNSGYYKRDAVNQCRMDCTGNPKYHGGKYKKRTRKSKKGSKRRTMRRRSKTRR